MEYIEAFICKWINKVKGAFARTKIIATKEGHQQLTEGSINNYEYSLII